MADLIEQMQEEEERQAALRDSKPAVQLGLYMDSQVHRVKAEEQDWMLPDPAYQPEDYTAPALLSDVKPDVKVADPVSTISLNFNKIDGAVDRISFEGDYEVALGRPRNPHGRTGIRGRGVLPRWGPNHVVHHIFTRCSKQQLGNKTVLEVAVLPSAGDQVSCERNFCFAESPCC